MSSPTRAVTGLLLLASGAVGLLVTLVLLFAPTSLEAAEAPGVDAPGCSWGVVRDIHPDLRGSPELLEACDETIAEVRRRAIGVGLGSGMLFTAGAVLRSGRSPQRS